MDSCGGEQQSRTVCRATMSVIHTHDHDSFTAISWGCKILRTHFYIDQADWSVESDLLKRNREQERIGHNDSCAGPPAMFSVRASANAALADRTGSHQSIISRRTTWINRRAGVVEEAKRVRCLLSAEVHNVSFENWRRVGLGVAVDVFSRSWDEKDVRRNPIPMHEQ